MPRLVGQQSHTETNVAILIIFAAVAGIILEYFGAIDFVPGFGQKSAYLQFQEQPANESMTEPDK